MLPAAPSLRTVRPSHGFAQRKRTLLMVSAAALITLSAALAAFSPNSELRVLAAAAGLVFLLILSRVAPAVVLVSLVLLFAAERVLAPTFGGSLHGAVAREMIIVTTLAGTVLGRKYTPRAALLLLLLAWTVIVLCAAILSPTPLRALLATRFYLPWPLLGLAAYVACRNEPSRPRRIIVPIVVSSAAFAIIGLLQYFTRYSGLFIVPDNIFTVRRFDALGAIGFTSGRPAFGFYMALSAATATWVFLYRRDWASPTVSATCAILCASATVVSLSRSSWIALFGGLFFAIRSSTSRRITAQTVLIMLLALPLVYLRWNPSASLPTEIATAGTEIGSLQERFPIWADAIDHTFSSPKRFVLGAGLGAVGNATLLSSAETPLLEVVDSTYIRVLFELGIAGIVALLLLAIHLRRAIRGLSSEGAGFVSAILATVLLFSLAVDAMFSLPGAPLAAILLGVGLAFRQPRLQEECSLRPQ